MKKNLKLPVLYFHAFAFGQFLKAAVVVTHLMDLQWIKMVSFVLLLENYPGCLSPLSFCHRCWCWWWRRMHFKIKRWKRKTKDKTRKLVHYFYLSSSLLFIIHECHVKIIKLSNFHFKTNMTIVYSGTFIRLTNG